MREYLHGPNRCYSPDHAVSRRMIAYLLEEKDYKQVIERQQSGDQKVVKALNALAGPHSYVMFRLLWEQRS